MLAGLDPRHLERVVFPLGEQTKAETRAEAARAGLEAATRAESQEACFLAGGDYRTFLERQGVEAQDGALVDEGGREVGRHGGFWRFTPGQRRGLGVSGPKPLYALRSDAATNTVVVGPRTALATRRVSARGRIFVPVSRVEAKLRHRSRAIAARVDVTPGGFRLELEEPVYGVAPGQSAVLYEGGAIVGAGTVQVETRTPPAMVDAR